MLKLLTRRFLLIVIGIFLSLICLEIGLRLAGWTISSYQQYKNNKALKNKSQYTIMCLGESTTQGQYPVQLQEILDNKYPNKFSVIDCGIPGTSLEFILNLLINNITKYKPNIAICMMGINNQLGQEKQIEYKNYILNLKVFKLLFYIYGKAKKQSPIVYDTRELLQNINLFNKKLQKAVNLFYQDKRNDAKIIFQELLQQNPKDEISYYFLSMINNNLQDYINAINLNFSFMRFEYYMRIISHFKSSNNTDDLEKAKLFAKMACNDKIPSINIDLYGMIKDIVSEEEKLKIKNEILNRNVDDTNYSLLALECLEQRDYQKAEEYFSKAEEARLQCPDTETVYSLYKLIVRKLINNNIKVICMQYPVRSILSLQKQLINEPYYQKLTFVSNEKNFKDALMKENYNDLFFDQFAGDFGHCTDLGNTMIAENIVNTLEKMLNLKQN